MYATRLRSPGATEHVKTSLLTWQAAGVEIGILDVATPVRWLPDPAVAETQMRRLYSWIAEALGPATWLDITLMVRRGAGSRIDPDTVPPASSIERLILAQRIAQECGLERARVYTGADDAGLAMSSHMFFEVARLGAPSPGSGG